MAVVGHAVVGAGALDGYHVVEVPNEELAAELAGKLAASYSGNFVIIGGPEGLFTSDDRIRGFQSRPCRGRPARRRSAPRILQPRRRLRGGA